MIYLPETVDAFGGADEERSYYLLTAAHLAARHEFGTFDFRLADIPASRSAPRPASRRSTASSPRSRTPALAGALMRLCESARIDAALCAALSRPRAAGRGDQPRAGRAPAAQALSTMLVRGVARSGGTTNPDGQGFARMAQRFFAPLRDAGADIVTHRAPDRRALQWMQD